MSDRTEFSWILLRRLVGRTPSTPMDVQEGQLRYDRDGAVDGHLYLARKKSGGSYEWLDVTPGTAGAAPADAKYIVQTADGTLTNEQALSALATGLVKNTTGTGVLSIATAGTDYPVVNAGYQTPPGPVAIDATTVTALASQECLARYLGYTTKDVTSVRVTAIVTTAANTITWAEAALASGSSVTPSQLTLLGSATDVSATFNSTGVKETVFTVNIPAGTKVYFLAGSDATTPFQLRATIGNEFLSPVALVMNKATTRPSTMAAPTSFNHSSSANYAAYLGFRWS